MLSARSANSHCRISTKKSTKNRKLATRTLRLENLECRYALAVDLQGAVNWLSQGPTSAIDGQTENLPGNNPVIGALHTIVTHPTDPDILHVGSVNGGIW